MGLGVGFQHFPRAVFFDEQDFGVTAGFFAVDVLVEGNGNFGFALGGIGVSDFTNLGGGDFAFFFGLLPYLSHKHGHSFAGGVFVDSCLFGFGRDGEVFGGFGGIALE